MQISILKAHQGGWMWKSNLARSAEFTEFEACCMAGRAYAFGRKPMEEPLLMFSDAEAAERYQAMLAQTVRAQPVPEPQTVTETALASSVDVVDTMPFGPVRRTIDLEQMDWAVVAEALMAYVISERQRADAVKVFNARLGPIPFTSRDIETAVKTACRNAAEASRLLTLIDPHDDGLDYARAS